MAGVCPWSTEGLHWAVQIFGPLTLKVGSVWLSPAETGVSPGIWHSGSCPHSGSGLAFFTLCHLPSQACCHAVQRRNGCDFIIYRRLWDPALRKQRLVFTFCSLASVPRSWREGMTFLFILCTMHDFLAKSLVAAKLCERREKIVRRGFPRNFVTSHSWEKQSSKITKELGWVPGSGCPAGVPVVNMWRQPASS